MRKPHEKIRRDGPPYDAGDFKPPRSDAGPVDHHDKDPPPIRGPPPVPRAAYSIPEFCEAYRFSTDFFGKMQREKWGPKTMRVGRRVLISIEAAEAWRLEREAAATLENSAS